MALWIRVLLCKLELLPGCLASRVIAAGATTVVSLVPLFGYVIVLIDVLHSLCYNYMDNIDHVYKPTRCLR